MNIESLLQISIAFSAAAIGVLVLVLAYAILINVIADMKKDK